MATNKLKQIKHELERVRYVRLSKKYRLRLIHFKQHYSALQNNRLLDSKTRTTGGQRGQDFLNC